MFTIWEEMHNQQLIFTFLLISLFAFFDFLNCTQNRTGKV